MNYTNDSDLPVVTDERLQESLKKTRGYTVLILKAGPKFEVPGPDRASGVTKIIWEHGKRNSALRLAGLMPIVCPITDGSGVIWATDSFSWVVARNSGSVRSDLGSTSPVMIRPCQLNRGGAKRPCTRTRR